jgi:hypothetical protein
VTGEAGALLERAVARHGGWEAWRAFASTWCPARKRYFAIFMIAPASESLFIQ